MNKLSAMVDVDTGDMLELLEKIKEGLIEKKLHLRTDWEEKRGYA